MCGLPNWLDVIVERAEGPSYRVVLEGMVLEYQAACRGAEYGPVERMRPQGQAWRDFLTALEAAGVWQWAADYVADAEPAGDVRWAVEIAAPFRQVSTCGHHAFPPGDAFPLFCMAMRELLEGRAFE